MRYKIIIAVFVIVVLVIGGVLFYEGLVDNELLQREYIVEEQVISIPNSDSTIVVKGWQWLANGGTEFHYRIPKGKTVKVADSTDDMKYYYAVTDGRYEAKFFDDRAEFTFSFLNKNQEQIQETVICRYP